MTKNDTYSVSAHCTNCNWVGSLTFARGKPATGAQLCPNCGCHTAVKTTPYLLGSQLTTERVWLPDDDPSPAPWPPDDWGKRWETATDSPPNTVSADGIGRAQNKPRAEEANE